MNNTIMDYIIAQCEIFDGQNIKIEHPIIHLVVNGYDSMADAILNMVDRHGDVINMIDFTNIINSIKNNISSFSNSVANKLVSATDKHMQKGYDDFDELINIGTEMQDKINKSKIHEMKYMLDTNSIEFMRQHALEQVTNISNDLISRARSELGQLMAGGKYNKKSFADTIENILQVNRSRAESIAQTEMSMAFNHPTSVSISDGSILAKLIWLVICYRWSFIILSI